MKNNASVLYGFSLIIFDAITLVAAFVLAYIFRVSLDSTPISQPVEARTFLVILLALLPCWIIIFWLLGLYSRNIYDKRFSEIARLFIGALIGTLFVVGIAYFSNDPIFPAKMVPVYGFGLTFVLLVISRNIARKIRQIMFRYNIGVSNVLIVGNTDSADSLIDWLAKPESSGFRVIGTVGQHKKGRIRQFKSFEEAVQKLGNNKIHAIMQTEMYSDNSRNNRILTYALNHHISYRFIPGNSELFIGNIDVELFQSSIPMVAVHQTPLNGWGRITKRLFDTVAATLMLVLFSPVMLVIAILNLLLSGGIFFRQARLTRYNKTFRVFKFRTQHKKLDGTTPEEAFKKLGREDLIKKYRANGDFLPNDPRVTKFGKFLRKTSLDELPQLFNVLLGQISLVGPRALIPEELEKYAGKNTILSVKSGLTGLAQVSGRRNISFTERRQLDLYYVQNWSFWMDIVILAKTVRVILTSEGAK